MRKSKENHSARKQPESPADQSPLKIPHEPVSLEELTRRAKRVKEIVAEIEAAKRIPPEIWFKEFDI